MNNIKSIIKSNFVLIAQYIVGAVMPLFLLPNLLSDVGPKTFSEYAVALSFCAIGTSIINYSFSLTGPQLIINDFESKNRRKIFFEITKTKLHLFCLFFIILLLSQYFIKSEINILPNEIRIYILIFLITASAVLNCNWYLMAQEKFNWSAFISFTSVTCTALLGILILSADTGRIDGYVLVIFFSLSSIISGFATYVLSFHHAKKTSRKLGDKNPDSNLRTGALLKNGLPLFISQSIAMLYGATGPLFISYYSNAEQVSIYSITEKIGNAIAAVLMLTLTAAYPKLIREYNSKNSQFLKIFKIISIFYIICSLFIAILYYFNSKFVNFYLYGEIDSGNLPFFQIIFLIICFSGPYSTAYLTIIGKSKSVIFLNITTLFIILLVNRFFVPLYGAAGWQISLILGYFPQLLFYIFIMLKREK